MSLAQPGAPAFPGAASTIIKDMNRWVLIDSNVSLDHVTRRCHNPGMRTQTSFNVHLTRQDRSRNMARFYALSLERTLFDELIVCRRWGRMGSAGRMKTEVFAGEIQALSALLAQLRTKRQRGYVVSRCPAP